MYWCRNTLRLCVYFVSYHTSSLQYPLMILAWINFSMIITNLWFLTNFWFLNSLYMYYLAFYIKESFPICLLSIYVSSVNYLLIIISDWWILTSFSWLIPLLSLLILMLKCPRCNECAQLYAGLYALLMYYHHFLRHFPS